MGYVNSLEGTRLPLNKHMGVEPKIRGLLPPKWMVKIMENPIQMDDFGGF